MKPKPPTFGIIKGDQTCGWIEIQGHAGEKPGFEFAGEDDDERGDRKNQRQQNIAASQPFGTARKGERESRPRKRHAKHANVADSETPDFYRQRTAAKFKNIATCPDARKEAHQRQWN